MGQHTKIPKHFPPEKAKNDSQANQWSERQFIWQEINLWAI